MFDDLTKEIKAQLYERAKSPLFGTFVIAWVAINIRAVIVFFSDWKVDQKFEYFSRAYPDLWSWSLKCLVFPSISAVLFLLIYPYPARWAYHYWRWQHVQVKKIQQKIDDETPITHEEANALRKTALEQQIALQAQLRTSAEMNNELRRQLQELTSQISAYEQSDKERDAKRAVLQGELDAAQKSLADLKASWENTKASTRDRKLPTLNIPDEIQAELGMTPNELKTFVELVRRGGRVNRLKITNDLSGSSLVDFEHSLGSLFERDLVVYLNDGDLSLTSDGRSLAVETGLTEYLQQVK